VETNDALWNTYHGGRYCFAINEQFDKILSKLLPADIAEAEVGVYSACYKLGLFMVLYRTAYTLELNHSFSAILMIKTANLRW
jgi:hypothetical protein